MIKINEIFFSIQGESTLVGLPTTFIRTSGCPLRCTYCDTQYAYGEGTSTSFDDILVQVEKNGSKYVCVTGGEPMVQKHIHELLSLLCDQGYQVSLETSGAYSCTKVDPRVRIILDVKTPDSGEPNTFEPSNLNLAHKAVEFKFVICSEADFDFAEEFVKSNNLAAKGVVLYSPSFSSMTLKSLAERILEKKSLARLQLQLHKYIWSESTRGV